MKTMKTMKVITLTLSILLLSHLIIGCFGVIEIDDPSVPDDLPEWVKEQYKWTNAHQQAYEDGRIHFNDDSSMMGISKLNKHMDDKILEDSLKLEVYRAIRNRGYSVEK